jgi:hypothetical protein
MRAGGEPAPYTAIFGFGTNKFDPEFGNFLIRLTATDDVANVAESIWGELWLLGIGENFEYSSIDRPESYENA